MGCLVRTDSMCSHRSTRHRAMRSCHSLVSSFQRRTLWGLVMGLVLRSVARRGNGHAPFSRTRATIRWHGPTQELQHGAEAAQVQHGQNLPNSHSSWHHTTTDRHRAPSRATLSHITLSASIGRGARGRDGASVQGLNYLQVSKTHQSQKSLYSYSCTAVRHAWGGGTNR